MTRQETYTFLTELLDGFEINETLFKHYLNTAQSYYENRRPWAYLRTEDASQTVSPNNTYETAKDLPSDFRKWYTRFPVVLTDGKGTPMQYLAEIPLHLKGAHRTDNSRFYCDYRAGKLYICGAPSESRTIRQYYIRKTDLISADKNSGWDFPSEYHEIIPYTIAAYHKYGVDYDLVNVRQADEHVRIAQAIYNSMEEWDAELAESALQGVDYVQSRAGGFGELSGNVNNLM